MTIQRHTKRHRKLSRFFVIQDFAMYTHDDDNAGEIFHSQSASCPRGVSHCVLVRGSDAVHSQDLGVSSTVDILVRKHLLRQHFSYLFLVKTRTLRDARRLNSEKRKGGEQEKVCISATPDAQYRCSFFFVFLRTLYLI